MLSDQRQYEMTEFICREGKAGIAELAKRFGVSGETVRRDLTVIAKGGRIRKVHGGAVAVRHAIRDESYAVRRVQSYESKQRIGEYAARLLRDNDIIGIDAGTCAEGFARAIYHVQNLTVVTHSLPVATILAGKIAAGELSGQVILPGGTLESETCNLHGLSTVAQLKRYRLDKAFISATAVSELGIMTSSEEDGLLAATLLGRAESAYVLAESEKLDKESFYLAATPEELRGLITDDQHPISDGLLQALKENGVELSVVPVGGERRAEKEDS